MAQGGIPYVLRATVTTGVAPAGGRKVDLPFFIHFLKIRVTGNDCALYFTQADYEANTNYVHVRKIADSAPYGEWSGPVETCAGERASLWLRGITGSSDVELVAFQTRG